MKRLMHRLCPEVIKLLDALDTCKDEEKQELICNGLENLFKSLKTPEITFVFVPKTHIQETH